MSLREIVAPDTQLPGNVRRNISIEREVLDSVDAYLSELSTEKLEQVLPNQEVTTEDRRNILIGLAMRMTYVQINNLVNTARKARGDEPINVGIARYKKNYGDLIDEIYGIIATRIGEVYKYADKAVRIGALNDMADVLRDSVMDEFNARIEDEMTIKKGNLFIKVLDRLNAEMGGKSLFDAMSRRIPSDDSTERGKAETFSKADIVQAVTQSVEDRYAGQLPPAIKSKISFTDYTACANGEDLSGVTMCWNQAMNKIAGGDQCAVQCSKVEQCSKFLNKNMVNNKAWLEHVREQRMTMKQIAIACGCSEYDAEIRGRVIYFLNKFEVYFTGEYDEQGKDDGTISEDNAKDSPETH
jgi:hypothetical protein